ncbi:MAG: hypothetical protein WC862_04075 [Patescibacteria group bacterium]
MGEQVIVDPEYLKEAQAVEFNVDLLNKRMFNVLKNESHHPYSETVDGRSCSEAAVNGSINIETGEIFGLGNIQDMPIETREGPQLVWFRFSILKFMQIEPRLIVENKISGYTFFTEKIISEKIKQIMTATTQEWNEQNWHPDVSKN